MTNFIFKSSARTTDLQKISQLINLLLNEQRHQRSDLSQIKSTLDYIIKIINHKDTLDYFSNGNSADSKSGD